MFYAFVGFVYVLTEQKAERERREAEARRDAVEFSLKNEVRFLIVEIDRRQVAVQGLAQQMIRLKYDRKALAVRKIYKMRPYETLEYCLWIWELWQCVRCSTALILEKKLDREIACHKAEHQQLLQTTRQVPLMAKRMDILKRQMVEEKTKADLVQRTITADYAKIIALMWERMFDHRVKEIWTLRRLHILDCEQKDERIAVLERDIAEDKHIQALKGMVVDLETRLKKSLDRRKQKGLVVPPNKGVKCVMCSREILHRNWKEFQTPKVPTGGGFTTPAPTPGASPMAKSASEADMSDGAKQWRLGLGAKFGEAAFTAVWRPP
jgi:DNA-directed RNA polymerase subunit RPC12/RpoP